MSGIDKMKNAAEELKGKATDNEQMEAEGKADQTSAHAKKAGENVKDTAGDIKDAFKN